MIQSFRHKGLQHLFERDDRRKVSAHDIQKLEHILAVLNRATKPDDMGLPGFHLHPLKGRLKGFWSVTVRTNWRVIFKIKDGHTYEVDLIDYHYKGRYCEDEKPATSRKTYQARVAGTFGFEHNQRG